VQLHWLAMALVKPQKMTEAAIGAEVEAWTVEASPSAKSDEVQRQC